MRLTITCEGVTRTYEGDYPQLSANEWGEIIQDVLDTVKDSE